MSYSLKATCILYATISLALMGSAASNAMADQKEESPFAVKQIGETFATKDMTYHITDFDFRTCVGHKTNTRCASPGHTFAVVSAIVRNDDEWEVWVMNDFDLVGPNGRWWETSHQAESSIMFSGGMDFEDMSIAPDMQKQVQIPFEIPYDMMDADLYLSLRSERVPSRKVVQLMYNGR